MSIFLYLNAYILGIAHIVELDNMVKTIIKHILWYQWYKEDKIKVRDFYSIFNYVNYFGGSPNGNISIQFDKSFKYYEPFDVKSFAEILDK